MGAWRPLQHIEHGKACPAPFISRKEDRSPGASEPKGSVTRAPSFETSTPRAVALLRRCVDLSPAARRTHLQPGGATLSSAH